MANGNPSSDRPPEEYVIRSGVRSGLKREFAFALKSQAQLSTSSLGRTRSSKPSPLSSSSSSSPHPSSQPRLPSPPPPPPPRGRIYNNDAKRLKKSPAAAAAAGGGQISVENPVLPAAPVVVVSEEDGLPEIQQPPPLKQEQEDVRPMEDDPVVVNPIINSDVQEDAARPESEADSASVSNAKDAMTLVSAADDDGGPRGDGRRQDDDDTAMEGVVDVPQEANCIAARKPLEETNVGSLSEMLMMDDPAVVVTPAPYPGHGTSKTDDCVLQQPGRRFTRSSLKSPQTELEGSGVEKPDVVNDQDDNREPSCSLETPARRFTRSLLKATAEDAPVGETSATTCSAGSVGSDETKSGANADDGSSSITPSKKMELKMSKKIALNKPPANVRELLGTGLLEGLPVKYIIYAGKNYGLEGVIKGNGILCSCALCKGSRVVSAYNFEVHSGSTKKHPSDYIFLENGKSLRDIMKECMSVPLDMLESAIQNAIGLPPPSKSFICLKCKEVFHTPRTGKFALLCDSCLERPHSTPSSAKMVSKVPARNAADGPLKKTSSQKKTILPTKVLAGDASESSSRNNSSQKKTSGRLTRKDLGLHKLVFTAEVLPEGTEVGYYVCGKKLLEGYIKDFGIYCHCCSCVVSPSQFEAHAGRASRRKPYNNIYTSNGVSLHELSVSLSKGRKLSASENDDLCSICADGGNLLLCDLCPRAFHKECVGLSSIPGGDWYCRYCQNMHQRERSLSTNDNAIAAGRVAGVDPIEQIIQRCIRIVTTATDLGGCAICRCHDFSRSSFDDRTVMLCDQCEKEYHVGCMKEHNMCDLQELPEGEWFCCTDCSRIHVALQDLLCGSQPLPDAHADIIKKKFQEKGINKDVNVDVRWRLVSGKTSPADSKPLLSEAVTIFHESFDPIVDAVTGRDLIPSMVYGREVRGQDYGGMYCAVLTVNSSVVSAGILRVLGCEVAELPLVATGRECQGLGYFQALFSCIEDLLGSLHVKHFVLPSADEAMSIWTKKFGFSKITQEQLHEYSKGAHPMIFQGTSWLHKPVPYSLASSQENRST